MAEITVIVDPNIYRLSAVKKAAYRLGDRCFVKIDLLPEGGIQVRLAGKSDKEPAHVLEGDFLNELLDQDLRESIASETERVRNLLLAQALAGLAPADADVADYREDPLGIGQPQVTKP